MVKRKRLEAPSTADLDRIEEQFRSETSPRGARGLAPIAQVAADSAALSSAEDAETRAARARAEADAARLKDAQAQGLLLTEIPLSEINEMAMIRDRMTLGEAELTELRISIAAHGLRLPIEVFELESVTDEGHRFGLLSGYRRLLAMRGLLELTSADKYKQIRAIVRPRTSVDAAFVAMIEENEIRQELSHFERGRIAVIAANQGAFTNTEEAVEKLYASGSRSKRSKVRSFALVFEELGDMLEFPEWLTERRGLKLANALRAGNESRLRNALADRAPADAEEEWAALEEAIAQSEIRPRDPARGGRPRARKPVAGWIDRYTIRTSTGVTIRRGHDSKGHILRLEGSAVDGEIMDSLMQTIQQLLEP